MKKVEIPTSVPWPASGMYTGTEFEGHPARTACSQHLKMSIARTNNPTALHFLCSSGILISFVIASSFDFMVQHSFGKSDFSLHFSQNHHCTISIRSWERLQFLMEHVGVLNQFLLTFYFFLQIFTASYTDRGWGQRSYAIPGLAGIQTSLANKTAKWGLKSFLLFTFYIGFNKPLH